MSRSRSKPFAKAPKPRRVPGTMNGTEREYSERLDIRKAAGQIAEYWFENLTFKLGSDLRYTPDFLVMLPDGSLEIHECKGTFIRDDARVKLLAAAERFPFRFFMAQKQAKKNGGGWTVEEIPSETWTAAA